MPTQIVSFHCVLKNSLGHLLGTTFNQNVLLSDQMKDQQLRYLVDALRDLRAGEKRRVFLSADRAYGYYDPSLVIVRSLDQLNIPQHVRLGETVVYATSGGKRNYRVIQLSDESVTLDGNHPLAGQDLIFEIEATTARDATAEEQDGGAESLTSIQLQ